MKFRIPASRPQARGFVLIDALIAIVIFSIGILGMVKMQAAAVAFASDAQYRTQAANFADQAIAQMWGSDPTQLGTNFGPSGTQFTAWRKLVTDPTNGLPGAAGSPPTITVVGSNLVTVTVNWQAPNDASPHQYVSITQVTR